MIIFAQIVIQNADMSNLIIDHPEGPVPYEIKCGMTMNASYFTNLKYWQKLTGDVSEWNRSKIPRHKEISPSTSPKECTNPKLIYRARPLARIGSGFINEVL